MSRVGMRLRGRPFFHAMLFLLAGCSATVVFVTALSMVRGSAAETIASTEEAKLDDGTLRLSTSQWRTVTVQPVRPHTFRSEFRTEGKIVIDDENATRIYAPYAGHVRTLAVAAGDVVQRGQLLFVIDAADSVDAQRDFVTALMARNKSISHLTLVQTIERRLSQLLKDNITPLKEWQEAQANLSAGENDRRTAEIALQAARNRLRLVGKTDQEIDAFEQTGRLTPDAPVYAPLAGTVLQRKVGPGQYVSAGTTDTEPVFLVGDTSKVWIAAYVRETDAAKVSRGNRVMFKVLAHPDRIFEARINYIASAIDAESRRLLVRATVDNAEGLLKPEMFANVTIVAEEGKPMPAVPLEAIIYEGSTARVWVVKEDESIELRQVRLGLADGTQIQVVKGLEPGERIITRGSLFIDRMASAG